MPKISLNWLIQWDGPITLPALTERFFVEGLGKAELVEVLERRNEEKTTELCGSKYHPDPYGRYRRAGSKKRTLGTRFGMVIIKAARVLDRTTGKTFVPLWKDVLIREDCIFQDDIIRISSSNSTRMTYRDVNAELGLTVKEVPSPRTINRRTIKAGSELLDKINGRPLTATTVQPDGTKMHAKDGGHHDVNIVLATSKGKEPQLCGLTVGENWDAHLMNIKRIKFQDEYGNPITPTMVSDMEKAMLNALCGENWNRQPCIPHIYMGTGYDLWKDGLMKSEEKDGYIRTLKRILFHLINSVKLHLPKNEKEAVRHRIQQTTKELKRLATRLCERGFPKAANFIREISNTVTTFAVLALEGIEIPWHNNLMERLMGEVGKRCKHKWMSWTPRGAQSLLTLLVVRILEPEYYRMFWDQKLYGDGVVLPNMGVQIIRLEVPNLA